jgi:hypothetical protein
MVFCRSFIHIEEKHSMTRGHLSVSGTVAALAVVMILIVGSQSLGADQPASEKSVSERTTTEKSVSKKSTPEKRTAEKLVAKDAMPAEAEKTKGRLPEHYAAVIDDKQREEIYGIQATYAPQIEKLQAQLNAVLGKRNAEIRAVLTPEQQIKVDELTAAEKKKDNTAKP